MGSRLRLSDLTAQEGERQRLRETGSNEGWQDQGYGYSGRPGYQQGRPSYDGHGYGDEYDDSAHGGYGVGMAL